MKRVFKNFFDEGLQTNSECVAQHRKMLGKFPAFLPGRPVKVLPQNRCQIVVWQSLFWLSTFSVDYFVCNWGLTGENPDFMRLRTLCSGGMQLTDIKKIKGLAISGLSGKIF